MQIRTCTSRTHPSPCVCFHLKKATRSLLFANHSKHQHRNLIGAVSFRSSILPRKSHIRQEQPYALGKMCKQSSQQSDQSCFCTNTRTTHTRQDKPYRLGAVRAGVVGARGRYCLPATVPVTVVWPCGVCCCIAENKQDFGIKLSTEKQSSAIIVHEAKRTVTSTRTTHTRQNNPYRLGLAPAGVIGARGRCYPAATVPVAAVFARVVCCCVA